jgi:hypothetical protein
MMIEISSKEIRKKEYNYNNNNNNSIIIILYKYIIKEKKHNFQENIIKNISIKVILHIHVL